MQRLQLDILWEKYGDLRAEVEELKALHRKEKVRAFLILKIKKYINGTKALKGYGDLKKKHKLIVISNCAIRSHGLVIRSQKLVIYGGIFLPALFR